MSLLTPGILSRRRWVWRPPSSERGRGSTQNWDDDVSHRDITTRKVKEEERTYVESTSCRTQAAFGYGLGLERVLLLVVHDGPHPLDDEQDLDGHPRDLDQRYGYVDPPYACCGLHLLRVVHGDDAQDQHRAREHGHEDLEAREGDGEPY